MVWGFDMAPLIKDGSGLFEQGLSLVARSDFDGAQQKFLAASRKLAKDGMTREASKAQVYAQLMAARPGRSHPQMLAGLSSYLGTLGEEPMMVGARTTTARALSIQLGLEAREAELDGRAGSTPLSPQHRYEAQRELASRYQQLGDEVLILPELFTRVSQTGSVRGQFLNAVAEEWFAGSLMAGDPLSAAEHYQSASQWWRLAGDEGRATEAARRTGALSVRASCWICGRQGSGHGIQFVSIPIASESAALKEGDASPLPSRDPTGHSAYVCKGCSSMISTVADQIATARDHALEAKLMAEIAAVKSRLPRG
jgi:hypothetical protein